MEDASPWLKNISGSKCNDLNRILRADWKEPWAGKTAAKPQGACPGTGPSLGVWLFLRTMEEGTGKTRSRSAPLQGRGWRSFPARGLHAGSACSATTTQGRTHCRVRSLEQQRNKSQADNSDGEPRIERKWRTCETTHTWSARLPGAAAARAARAGSALEESGKTGPGQSPRAPLRRKIPTLGPGTGRTCAGKELLAAIRFCVLAILTATYSGWNVSWRLFKNSSSLYTLNLYNVICQLYCSETGKINEEFSLLFSFFLSRLIFRCLLVT